MMRITFCKLFFVSFLLLIASFIYADEDITVAFTDFSFFLSPKILEDGSITDVGFGLVYNDHWSGELGFRFTNIEKNDKISGAEDSLNAIKENILEVFFLPAKYRLIDQPKFRFWAGVGLYYEFNKLIEKGFFDMPVLENIGLERVNSYTNNFSMHIFGPLFETGLNFSSDKFKFEFNACMVPFFFLNAVQKISITPLLHPDKADFSQNTFGSPRVFLV